MTYLDDIEALVGKTKIEPNQDAESYLDDVVEHFGTKGMKWGVRKQERKSDKEWAKKVKVSGPEITNNVIARSKPIIDKINGKPEYKNIKNANESTYKKYLNEHQTAFNKVLHEEITKTVGWESPSGKAKTVYLIGAKGNLIVDSIKTSKLPDSLQQDSLEDNLDEFYLPKLKSVVVDKMIVGYELDTEDDVIEHFGVRGMRWGVRKDRRGGSDSSEGGSSGGKPSKKEVKSPIKNKGTKNLDNKELKELVTRMELEQKYSKMMEKPPNKGAELAGKVLVSVGTTLATAVVMQALSGPLTKKGLINKPTPKPPPKPPSPWGKPTGPRFP